MRTVTGALGALAGVAVAGTLTRIASNALTSAANLSELSDRANTTASALSKISFAARQFGVEQQNIVDGMRELNSRADEFAKTGGGPAAEAFQRIGINAKEARQIVRNTGEGFNEIIRRIFELESAAARTRVLEEIFGDQAAEQLAQIDSSFFQLQKRAKSLGIVISDELADNADKARDRFRVLGDVLRAQLTKAVAENADQLAELAQTLRRNLPDVLDTVISSVRLLARNFDFLIGVIGGGAVAGVIANITVAARGLAQAFYTLRTAMLAIPGSRLLKVLGGIATALGVGLAASQADAAQAAQNTANKFNAQAKAADNLKGSIQNLSKAERQRAREQAEREAADAQSQLDAINSKIEQARERRAELARQFQEARRRNQGNAGFTQEGAEAIEQQRQIKQELLEIEKQLEELKERRAEVNGELERSEAKIKQINKTQKGAIGTLVTDVEKRQRINELIENQSSKSEKLKEKLADLVELRAFAKQAYEGERLEEALAAINSRIQDIEQNNYLALMPEYLREAANEAERLRKSAEIEPGTGNVALSGIDIEQWRDEIRQSRRESKEAAQTAGQSAEQAMKDATEQTSRFQREAERALRQMGDRIQDVFADGFRDVLDGSIDSFKDFGDKILDIWKNTAAEIAAAAIMPQITPAVGEIGELGK